MTKLSHPGSLPYLPGWPFPAGSDIHCPPKWSDWKVDSMGFRNIQRTPELEFGREIYDLPKFEVT